MIVSELKQDMKLVFLGGIGSGKGTQTAKISKDLVIPRIAAGEVLKEAIVTKSDLGSQAQHYLKV